MNMVCKKHLGVGPQYMEINAINAVNGANMSYLFNNLTAINMLRLVVLAWWALA